MSTLRVLYHMARADFFERTRRYSFLIMLGLIVFLGYSVNDGTIALYLDQYRGIYNSAWVGSLMALVVNFFIGWFGFYLVNNSVARDYQTGLGQIMATTPLSRPAYMLGKWLSNFAVLAVMVGIMALSGLALQLIQREDPVINLWALLSPLLIMSLSLMALVAAIAILFDTISWLRGGLGNLVYFFGFATVIPVFMESSLSKIVPALDPMGLALFSRDLTAAALAAFPNYGGGISLGVSGIAIEGTFVWQGMQWTPDILVSRLAIVGTSVVVVLFAALIFDRFDTSKTRVRTPRNPKQSAADAAVTDAAPPVLVGQAVSALTPVKPGFRFHSVLWAELKLLLKGLPWWWYLGALILTAIGLFNDAQVAREQVLMFTWVWPILIWSGLGVRENRYGTQQMVFSAANPLARQLPATYLAGIIVAILTGSGVALRLLLAGDTPGLVMWLIAIFFIPAFALACGVWSGSSKLFEVLYVIIWYLGPLKRIPALDYLGATPQAQPAFWLAATIVLVSAAVIGRWRQIRV